MGEADLIRRLRNRIHDSHMENERLMDEAAAALQEALEALRGPDGADDINISRVGRLRSLLDTVREPTVLNAIYAGTDDPDAINEMLHQVEMLERQARALLAKHGEQP